MATRAQLYKEIQREYDHLRSQKAALQRERIEKVERRFPRLAQIREEMALAGVEAAKIVLQKPQNLTESALVLKGKQQELLEERKRILDGAGIPMSYLEMEYDCPKCKDTGFIEGEPCICFKRRWMDRMYDQSNIRDILERENFDYYDLSLFSQEKEEKEGISPRENAGKILRRGLAFVENFDKGEESLLLYGPTGLGKTFFCSCIAKELLDRGKVVLYLTAGQLFRKLEELHFSHDTEEETEDWDKELLEADLLIIDDLGTEFPTLFTATELFRIMNDRKLAGKSVIISTNLSPEEMTALYSDRVTSRIREYGIIRFFGEDVRYVKKKREMTP